MPVCDAIGCPDSAAPAAPCAGQLFTDGRRTAAQRGWTRSRCRFNSSAYTMTPPGNTLNCRRVGQRGRPSRRQYTTRTAACMAFNDSAVSARWMALRLPTAGVWREDHDLFHADRAHAETNARHRRTIVLGTTLRDETNSTSALEPAARR